MVSDDGDEVLDPSQISKAKKKQAEVYGAKGGKNAGVRKNPKQKMEELEKMDFENMSEE